MGKVLFWGWIGTWLGVYFGCDLNGWLGIAQANIAAMGWTVLWLSVAMIFDL